VPFHLLLDSFYNMCDNLLEPVASLPTGLFALLCTAPKLPRTGQSISESASVLLEPEKLRRI
jgi:hypothetical protein